MIKCLTSDSSGSGAEAEDAGWPPYRPQLASSPPSEAEVSGDDAEPTKQNKQLALKLSKFNESNPKKSTVKIG